MIIKELFYLTTLQDLLMIRLMNTKDRPTHIYALRDPRDNRVRYIGKTINKNARMSVHRTAPPGQHRFGLWLKELRGVGLCPVMEVVETVPTGHDWCTREMYWIAYWRSQEPDLTNTANGGQTATTLKQSELTVARRLESINQKRISQGKPPLQIGVSAKERRHRYSIGRKKELRRQAGHPERLSPEWKAKIAEGMRSYRANAPEAYKELQRKNGTRFGKIHGGKKRGPLSEEMKAKLSAIHKARLASLTPEQREARMAAAKRANWRNNPLAGTT